MVLRLLRDLLIRYFVCCFVRRFVCGVVVATRCPRRRFLFTALSYT